MGTSKKITKERKFNGVWYFRWQDVKAKREANQVARKLRESGMPARVVKAQGYPGWWTIWTRGRSGRR